MITIDRHRPEDILAGRLKSGEKTCNQVAAHENMSQLVVVLVINPPK